MQEMEDPGLDELLHLLIDHSIVTCKSSPGLSAKWDSVLLLGVFGSFLVCLVLWTIGKVAGLSPPMLWRISLWVYAFGLLSAVGLVVGMFVASARLVAQPVASILRMHVGPVKRDYKLLLRLRAVPAAKLEFLNARLRKEADHLRGRIGVLIGTSRRD